MQHQISEERFKKLQNRYKQFTSMLDKPEKDPVKVFDPLSAKQIEELKVIRDISVYLKTKKLEDINKQAVCLLLTSDTSQFYRSNMFSYSFSRFIQTFSFMHRTFWL